MPLKREISERADSVCNVAGRVKYNVREIYMCNCDMSTTCVIMRCVIVHCVIVRCVIVRCVADMTRKPIVKLLF